MPMTMGLSPCPATPAGERRLLLLALDPEPATETLPEAEALVLAPLDWRVLSALAAHHRVEPLLYNLLRRLPRDPLSAPVFETLRSAYRDHLAANLRLYATLVDVLAALHGGGLRPLVLKGPALAEPLYADLALRPMGDIDLLLPPGEIEPAEAMLGDLGYRYGERRPRTWYRTHHYHLTYAHPDRRPPVELHWHIAHSRHPRRLRVTDSALMVHWHTRARGLVLAGQRTRVLCPADQALHLCMHWLKHRFAHRRAPVTGGALLQLADIALVARRCTHADWALLAAEAETHGLLGPVAVVLHLANELIPCGTGPDPLRPLALQTPHERAALGALHRALFALPEDGCGASHSTAGTARQPLRALLRGGARDVLRRASDERRLRSWLGAWRGD
jgi:hypothetical protein